ncbi:MAG: hypothetical protein IJ062_11180 [Firmicutes bacterium]|nr:hypothetical protein [Bacillota bacterium]
MYFCRFRFWGIVLVCIGAGLCAGAFLSFWKPLIIGIILIAGGIWLWMK